MNTENITLCQERILDRQASGLTVNFLVRIISEQKKPGGFAPEKITNKGHFSMNYRKIRTTV